MFSVSSRSRVAATSRIDLTPAHTTRTGVRERVVKSADSSHVSTAPRCTPPRPPVANTAMPARAARCAVDATVVAPMPPRAATLARSRTLTLTTDDSVATRPSASSSSPIRATPSTTAMVAGTAPPARTSPSISRAIRRLSGRGSPWLMIVLSSATTGAPDASASATSGCTCTRDQLPLDETDRKRNDRGDDERQDRRTHPGRRREAEPVVDMTPHRLPPHHVTGVDQLVHHEAGDPRHEHQPAGSGRLGKIPGPPRHDEVVDDENAEQRHEDRAEQD